MASCECYQFLLGSWHLDKKLDRHSALANNYIRLTGMLCRKDCYQMRHLEILRRAYEYTVFQDISKAEHNCEEVCLLGVQLYDDLDCHHVTYLGYIHGIDTPMSPEHE